MGSNAISITGHSLIQHHKVIIDMLASQLSASASTCTLVAQTESLAKYLRAASLDKLWDVTQPARRGQAPHERERRLRKGTGSQWHRSKLRFPTLPEGWVGRHANHWRQILLFPQCCNGCGKNPAAAATACTQLLAPSGGTGHILDRVNRCHPCQGVLRQDTDRLQPASNRHFFLKQNFPPRFLKMTLQRPASRLSNSHVI